MPRVNGEPHKLEIVFTTGDLPENDYGVLEDPLIHQVFSFNFEAIFNYSRSTSLWRIKDEINGFGQCVPTFSKTADAQKLRNTHLGRQHELARPRWFC
jgi:hypothetical protein